MSGITARKNRPGTPLDRHDGPGVGDEGRTSPRASCIGAAVQELMRARVRHQ